MNKLSVFLLAIALFALSPAAFAEPSKGTLSLVYENDIFHSDRYYTNGARASWLSNKNAVPDWAINTAIALPFIPEYSSIRLNYAVGQNMYTPTDIKLESPPADDRPYAGWLYASVGLITETYNRLDQLELSVGIVGPGSYAEQTQKTVHKAIGSPEPQGWEYQLHNEPVVNLMYQRSIRSYVSESFLGVPFDITPSFGFSLGNAFTYASSGVVSRYGMIDTDDFGPPRIQPSLPGSGYFKNSKKLKAYAFAGFEGRVVYRNIFLDGNTFEDSRQVEKKPMVVDFQYGGVLTYKNLRLTYTHVIRSQEFDNQAGVRQDFTALALSVQY